MRSALCRRALIVFPVFFRKFSEPEKEADFPASGVPYIGTGNGRIIRQQEGVSPPVNRTLSVLECSCQGVGGRYPIVGPVAELNLLFSPKEFLHRR